MTALRGAIEQRHVGSIVMLAATGKNQSGETACGCADGETGTIAKLPEGTLEMLLKPKSKERLVRKSPLISPARLTFY